MPPARGWQELLRGHERGFGTSAPLRNQLLQVLLRTGICPSPSNTLGVLSTQLRSGVDGPAFHCGSVRISSAWAKIYVNEGAYGNMPSNSAMFVSNRLPRPRSIEVLRTIHATNHVVTHFFFTGSRAPKAPCTPDLCGTRHILPLGDWSE